jgi:hypothetical protein
MERGERLMRTLYTESLVLSLRFDSTLSPADSFGLGIPGNLDAGPNEQTQELHGLLRWS